MAIHGNFTLKALSGVCGYAVGEDDDDVLGNSFISLNRTVRTGSLQSQEHAQQDLSP